MRNEKGKWLPGYCPNAKGRPRNTHTTIKIIDTETQKEKKLTLNQYIKHVAISNLPERLNDLMEHCKEGKSWAFSIYYELVFRVSNKETVKNMISRLDADSVDTEKYLECLALMIQDFQELSLDEIQSLLKTFNQIKFTDSVQKENLLSNLSDSKIESIMNIITSEEKDHKNENNNPTDI